ncbi:glycerophosphoryl diester phosphodiesterase [Paenibacillus cellulosilyticus]|uniref:Glycerophosphoryl diester phosphodiesterase n=1 Tax=Paenibacillus cellulosilyticus TaxID=375489 RepID=A0A2V2YWE4_9BACL|nr:glycerophosphodiester phosphodiesterase [Paenibacillus cellulosilyticus]PWW05076.1 glycerophosphoryl diester phosphodiesterase [Paenibacillus cellulosilyticus]QKS48928.1 glycerophosphodiester phosphodiesterase [Paenibacillus cellulosilyticus]
MLKLLSRSIRDFRAAYPKLLFFEYLYMLLTSVIIIPIITLIFNRVLTVIGSGSLMNEDIAELGLNWQGMVGLIAIGLIASFAVFIELCVLVVLVQQRYFGNRVAITDALLTALRQTPRLLGVGSVQLVILLLVLIPFVDSPMSESFYALFNVPIFLERNVLHLSLVMSIVYVVILTAAVYLIMRWVFVLHFIVLEGRSVGAAIRSSLDLTRGKQSRVLVSLFLINVLVIGTGFAALSSLSFLPYWLNHNVLKAFTEHYSLTLTSMLTYMLTLAIMPLNIIVLTRLFYVFGRERGQAPRDHLRLYRSFIGRWEHNLADAARRYTRRRTLFAVIGVIYVSLMIFVGVKASSHLVYAKWSVLISAHRGGDIEFAPENSMPAILSSIEQGIQSVEIDVQLTKDGVAVLNHDATLYRMTGVKSSVSDLTYAQVSKLSLGLDEEGASIPIATLEEVLAEAQGQIKLLIDLKPTGPSEPLVKEVVQLVHDFGMEQDVYIQSFDSSTLRQIRQLAPEIRIGQIMYFAVGNLSSLDVDFYTVEQIMVTKQLLDQAHNAGREVWVWTVNGRHNLKEMLKFEVDGIITDTPAMAQSMVGIDL